MQRVVPAERKSSCRNHAFFLPEGEFEMSAYTLRSNLEWIDLPDCAGLLENGKCEYLRVASCEGPRCPFFRPREAEADARLAVYRRLAACDESTQQRISAKYYGGKRPWVRAARTE